MRKVTTRIRTLFVNRAAAISQEAAATLDAHTVGGLLPVFVVTHIDLSTGQLCQHGRFLDGHMDNEIHFATLPAALDDA